MGPHVALWLTLANLLTVNWKLQNRGILHFHLMHGLKLLLFWDCFFIYEHKICNCYHVELSSAFGWALHKIFCFSYAFHKKIIIHPWLLWDITGVLSIYLVIVRTFPLYYMAKHFFFPEFSDRWNIPIYQCAQRSVKKIKGSALARPIKWQSLSHSRHLQVAQKHATSVIFHFTLFEYSVLWSWSARNNHFWK